MILSIKAIEDAELLGAIAEKQDKLQWTDGRETAGTVAGKVKRNEQAVMSEPAAEALAAEITKIILSNPVVKAASQPRRFSKLLISKTSGGGHYGSHVDNALMGAGEGRMRSDLSFTLFLTEPDAYEGGELVIHHAGAAQRVKGALGELVLYPSTSVHEVTPVTSGTRIVCVGWIESLIADGAARETLFDLENLRVSLRASLPAGSAELLTLDKVIANLLRRWAKV
ncbi:MAG: Fe2+-dependent dioxygenase [Erythrobacter sp.]